MTDRKAEANSTEAEPLEEVDEVSQQMVEFEGLFGEADGVLQDSEISLAVGDPPAASDTRSRDDAHPTNAPNESEDFWVELDRRAGVETKKPDSSAERLDDPVRAPESHASDPEPPDGLFDIVALDRKDAVRRIGILGGKGVGKSYLFHAMIYRLLDSGQSGALSTFVEGAGVKLAQRLYDQSVMRRREAEEYIFNYRTWTRLRTTLEMQQSWYRLSLPYRTGPFGWRQSQLEVEFFDGSGEVLSSKDPAYRELWIQTYGDVRVMIFCLPLWAAFPGAGLSKQDLAERDLVLQSFFKVVGTFRNFHDELQPDKKIRTLLALTMADDQRTALTALRENWIASFLQDPTHYLNRIGTDRGIALYLQNARKVSSIVHEEFAASQFADVRGIPQKLDFGTGAPWIVPVSAIDGQRLLQLERQHPDERERALQGHAPPTPVHVELPLLVALCEHTNALM